MSKDKLSYQEMYGYQTIWDNKYHSLRHVVIMLAIMLSLILALYFLNKSMQDTIEQQQNTIKQLQGTVKLQQEQIEKLSNYPTWFINAYNKCLDSKSVPKNFEKSCIAFELQGAN